MYTYRNGDWVLTSSLVNPINIDEKIEDEIKTKMKNFAGLFQDDFFKASMAWTKSILDISKYAIEIDEHMIAKVDRFNSNNEDFDISIISSDFRNNPKSGEYRYNLRITSRERKSIFQEFKINVISNKHIIGSHN